MPLHMAGVHACGRSSSLANSLPAAWLPTVMGELTYALLPPWVHAAQPARLPCWELQSGPSLPWLDVAVRRPLAATPPCRAPGHLMCAVACGRGLTRLLSCAITRTRRSGTCPRTKWSRSKYRRRWVRRRRGRCWWAARRHKRTCMRRHPRQHVSDIIRLSRPKRLHSGSVTTQWAAAVK